MMIRLSGTRGERPECRVVEVSGLGQSGDRRLGRPRAGRHHEPLPLDTRAAVEQHRVVGVEGGRRRGRRRCPRAARASSESSRGDRLDHLREAGSAPRQSRRGATRRGFRIPRPPRICRTSRAAWTRPLLGTHAAEPALSADAACRSGRPWRRRVRPTWPRATPRSPHRSPQGHTSPVSRNKVKSHSTRPQGRRALGPRRWPAASRSWPSASL